MKILKKFVAAILIAAFLVLPAAAEEIEKDTAPQPVTASDEGIMPCAEVFEWYFRYYNGRPQRRLWSVTYSYWVTDWEYCD